MSNGAPHPAPPGRLPIFGTIAVAYGFAFRNAGPLARAAAVPFAVTLVADMRLLWALHEETISVLARLLWFLLPFAATIPFATQCHRYFLDPTPANLPRFGFPWSRRETAFMMNALGLFGLMFLLNAIALPFVGQLAPGGAGAPAGSGIQMVLIALVLLLTIYVVARFSLVLPAAAIGRPFRWRESWRHAAGHGAALAAVMILAPLPWLVPALVHILAGPDVGDTASFILVTAVIEACGLISTAVVMIALAAAYRWIMSSGGTIATVAD